jgi:hypothetical protein
MDISIKVSDSASYVDENGTTHSAFQENLVLLLVEAYYGFVKSDASLVDDVLQELPGMRLAAESLMLDTGAAKRPSGRGYNSTTQSDADTYTSLFSSPCKLKAEPARRADS